MEQKLKDLVETLGNELGWSVSFDGGAEVLISVDFNQQSNAGQDFHCIVDCIDNNADELIDNISQYYENFDPEEAAMLWCDHTTGKGINGAPHHLKDIIKDMEECEEQLHQLALKFEYNRHELRQASIHKVKVQVTEHLQKVVEIDAINGSDACEKVEEMVNGSEIILTADDFTTRNIEPYEDK